MKKRFNSMMHRRIWTALICAAMILSFCAPAGGMAEGKAVPKVRIGWYQSNMFQEGMTDDTVKSGYCYDYIQKVADYVSWEYEYVYGEWTELFTMLQNGAIDMLGGVSYTEERAATMLFPDTAMGNDQYFVYKRSTDDSISAGDLSTAKGKTAGGIQGNRITDYLLEWSDKNGLDLQIVTFDSFAMMEDALKNGEIDLMPQTINNVMDTDSVVSLAKIGEEPFWLAVATGRTDLLDLLNTSVNTMLSIDPFILQSMQYDNYGTALISRNLTDEERQWVAAHPTVTVGYMDNYLPYCDLDSDGHATGLMTDVMGALLKSLGLDTKIKLRYEAYHSVDDMLAALKSGRIDIAFPVQSNLWDLERIGVDATTSVVSCSETFIYRGVYRKEDVKTIAVNANNAMQIAYCSRMYPNAELLSYSSIDECLAAVLNGYVDGTILNTLRTELVTRDMKYSGLSYVHLEHDEGRSLGVNQHNTTLLLLLNRGLKLIGSSYGIEKSYQYMGLFNHYNAIDFIRDNMIWIAPIVILLVGVIIVMLVHNLRQKAYDLETKNEYIKQVNVLNAELENATEDQKAQLQKISALNEELRAARNEAENANRAKTLFLNNMSHDIRTPLNAIMGFTALMEKEKDDPAVISDYVSKVRVSGEYLMSIINNVLDMARIESGHAVIAEEFIDLLDEENLVMASMGELLRRKNLTFTMSNTIKHRYVLLDSAKLRQIMMNILSNAEKYTPENGSIHVQMDELPCEKPGCGTYRMAITDTGIGMSPEFLEHIFDMFSRERNTTESKVVGTGLGMSIVKKLVDLLDGTIEVQSVPGKGSTFTVTFDHKIVEDPTPYLHTQDRENEEIEESRASFAGRRVLIAEDNDLNAEIAIAILNDLGLEVDRAADGVECIDHLMRAEPDTYALILMDIQMPYLNGYDATRQIRTLADPRRANIPIIAMTANAFDEDRRNAFDAGMNGHLAKPIEIPKLVSMLRKTLGAGA